MIDISKVLKARVKTWILLNAFKINFLYETSNFFFYLFEKFLEIEKCL